VTQRERVLSPAAAPPATRFGWKDFLRNDTPTLTRRRRWPRPPPGPDLLRVGAPDRRRRPDRRHRTDRHGSVW